MNKNIIILLTVAVAIGLFFTYKRISYQRSKAIPKSDILFVGTAADFRPFSYIDKNNKITGFDIDIAKEIAKQLGKTIEITDIPFDSLLPLLKSGRIQMIAAGMSSTSRRKKNALFTEPYLTGNELLIVTLEDNKIDSLEDLKDKEVIVNTGYLGDLYMSKIPNIKIKRVNSVSDAFTFLKNKKGYAFVGGYQSIKPLIEKYKDESFNTLAIEDTDENSSLVVSNKYPELFKDIEKALTEIQTNGTIKALKEKWNIA